MFFLVYIILFGGSDFHERDFIGMLFNRLMGGLGVSLSKMSCQQGINLIGGCIFADFFSSQRFHNCMERWVGAACCRRLTRVQDYVFYQKNPILPCLYLCFVSGRLSSFVLASFIPSVSAWIIMIAITLKGGFYIFAMFAFPFLPFHPDQSWGISSYHKINAFLVIGGCLSIFARAMYSGLKIISMFKYILRMTCPPTPEPSRSRNYHRAEPRSRAA